MPVIKIYRTLNILIMYHNLILKFAFLNNRNPCILSIVPRRKLQENVALAGSLINKHCYQLIKTYLPYMSDTMASQSVPRPISAMKNQDIRHLQILEESRTTLLSTNFNSGLLSSCA